MRQSSFAEDVGKIQMHEVNQETLHYERMIELKENEIRTIKDRMQDALKVQEDMKNLVFEQGDRLNEVEDNIDSAGRNVRDANENLIDAKKEHMSAKKKKICIVVIVAVVILAILIPILIKFA
jgi:t-SNARE complex subunit (syntaxin)